MTVAGVRPRTGRTYRAVRLVTPLPALWLLLSVLVLALTRGEVLPSISEYYTGPLRDVLVGALTASALGLVVLEGESRLEDLSLDVAGFAAVLVALVPISFQDGLDTARAAERAGTPLPVTSADLVVNLRLAVATYLVVVALLVVGRRLLLRPLGADREPMPALARFLTVVARVAALAVGVLLVALLLGVQRLGGFSLFTAIHVASAGVLIVALSFASASHALPERLRSASDAAPDGDGSRRVFTVVTALMWVGLLVGGALIVLRVPYAVIVTEIVEVVLFLVFWFTASREEWRELGRRGRRLLARDA